MGDEKVVPEFAVDEKSRAYAEGTVNLIHIPRYREWRSNWILAAPRAACPFRGDLSSFPWRGEWIGKQAD